MCGYWSTAAEQITQCGQEHQPLPCLVAPSNDSQSDARWEGFCQATVLPVLLHGFLFIYPTSNTPHFHKVSWCDLKAPPSSHLAWQNHLLPAMNDANVILLFHREEDGAGVTTAQPCRKPVVDVGWAEPCRHAEPGSLALLWARLVAAPCDWDTLLSQPCSELSECLGLETQPIQPAQLSGPTSHWGVFISGVSALMTAGRELGSFLPIT